MAAGRGVESGRWRFGATARLFVLPPLLTLAIVISALAVLLDHQTRQSLQATFVTRCLPLAAPCSLCHDGALARVPAARATPQVPVRLKSAAASFAW